ncbi:MAG: hypothetical protein OXQ31_06170 [Spirochaetaceae bacterium]|nr:hypothetical protein [Spirochaetaceae bacterium]
MIAVVESDPFRPNFTAQRQARIDVYIDFGDAHENLGLFDGIEKRKKRIEDEL